MKLLNLICGWVTSNTHDEANQSLVPWGERRLVPNTNRTRYIDNHGAGLVELIEWWACRLREYAEDGWHMEAMIEVLRDWEDE